MDILLENGKLDVLNIFLVDRPRCARGWLNVKVHRVGGLWLVEAGGDPFVMDRSAVDQLRLSALFDYGCELYCATHCKEAKRFYVIEVEAKWFRANEK